MSARNRCGCAPTSNTANLPRTTCTTLTTMAKGHPVSLRIPDEVREVIRERMKESGRDFSSIANEMLMESAKMRRIPGVFFIDSASGRTAAIGGTGIKVWLLILAYHEMDNNWERLRVAFHWLSEQQLRAALAYAEA